MKILFWTELFWPHIGGVEVLTSELLPELIARGHEIAVVTENSTLELPEEDEWQGIPIYRFRLRSTLASRDMKAIGDLRNRIASLKQSFQPDLVHMNNADPSAMFYFLTKTIAPSPMLYTMHAFPMLVPEESDVFKRMLREADWVVGISDFMIREAARIDPTIASRSSRIYEASKCAIASPAPPTFDPPRILCLGRLIQDKGFDIAVRAFATIAEQFPSAKLEIVGDGAEQSRLRSIADELGISSRVEFIGWVPPEDTFKRIEASSLVVMPSRWEEPYGIVALQAQQLGRPIVATRVGGLPEVVDDGVTGILVEKERAEDIVDAVTRLLENPDKATKMGQAGIERAEAVFGWPKIVDAYDALYGRLAKQNALSG